MSTIWTPLEQQKIEHYRKQRIARERDARDSALQQFARNHTQAELTRLIDTLKIHLTVTRWVSAGAVVVMGYALFVALQGGCA